MIQPMIPNYLRFCLALLALASLSGCATAGGKTAGLGVGKRLTIRTTAYTQTEPGGSNNALGTRLHYGGKEFSAASDWSWMPLGTRFKMLDSGRIYIIEDYGSALVGKQTIDLYVPTRREMNAWGVRNVPIEILEWGSKAISLKLLAPRAIHSHVARMCAQLRRDGVQPES